MKKKKIKRKIVQIAFSHYDLNGVLDSTMYALCNDGSLWTYNWEHQYWIPAPQLEIPQE